MHYGRRVTSSSIFTGLSAFPLTPLRDDRVDAEAYASLVGRLVAAGVDSITALGSTGSYAYFSVEERRAVARLALRHAGDVPVVVGVGALRTRDAVELAVDAEGAGAAGVLLAPVSYQPLRRDDVYELYRDVTAATALPVVVYDNPGTTRFTFDDDLYRSVAALPGVASIKIPGVPADPAAAETRVAELRSLLPSHVTLGISGDASAARGLNAGCDAWYSVVGGTLPELAVALTRAARSGDAAGAEAASTRLAPLWALFSRHGSLRVVAAVAEQLELVPARSLPRPLLGLTDAERREVADVVEALDLTR